MTVAPRQSRGDVSLHPLHPLRSWVLPPSQAVNMGLAASSGTRRAEAEQQQQQQQQQRANLIAAELLSARAELDTAREHERQARKRAEQLDAAHRRELQLYFWGSCAVVPVMLLGVAAIVRLRSHAAQHLQRAAEQSAAAAKAAHMMETQARDVKKFGHQKFATAILGTADDLQRALGHVNEDALRTNEELRALHSGVQMISAGLERCVRGKTAQRAALAGLRGHHCTCIRQGAVGRVVCLRFGAFGARVTVFVDRCSKPPNWSAGG